MSVSVFVCMATIVRPCSHSQPAFTPLPNWIILIVWSDPSYIILSVRSIHICWDEIKLSKKMSKNKWNIEHKVSHIRPINTAFHWICLVFWFSKHPHHTNKHMYLDFYSSRMTWIGTNMCVCLCVLCSRHANKLLERLSKYHTIHIQWRLFFHYYRRLFICLLIQCVANKFIYVFAQFRCILKFHRMHSAFAIFHLFRIEREIVRLSINVTRYCHDICQTLCVNKYLIYFMWWSA